MASGSHGLEVEVYVGCVLSPHRTVTLDPQSRRELDPNGTLPPGIWVKLVAGEPPRKIPDLQEVAALQRATLTQWEQVVHRYGLPSTTIVTLGDPTDDDEGSSYSRILYKDHDGNAIGYAPAQALRGLAASADVLLASAQALRGKPERLRSALDQAFQSLPTVDPRSDEGAALVRSVLTYLPADSQWPATNGDLTAFAEAVLTGHLTEALRGLVPVVTPGENRRLQHRFHSQGWWPLTLLRFLVPSRNRLAPRGSPICQECGKRLTVDRMRRGAKYCSGKCYRRVKRRNHYHRHREGQGFENGFKLGGEQHGSGPTKAPAHPLKPLDRRGV